MVPSLTTYDVPFPPKWGFHMPQHTRMVISATGDPIHFMFGSRVGFSGTADRTALLRFGQIQDGGHRNVGKISSGDISATGRPINFMFGYRVRFSGTVDLIALFSIQTNSRRRPPPFWRWPPPSWIISNGHISATAHDLLI